MADPLVQHHEFGAPWTIDDLKDLPDDATGWYEIYDGSLIVTPHPGVFHGGASNRLHRLLTRQAPDDLLVSHDIGARRLQSQLIFKVPGTRVART